MLLVLLFYLFLTSNILSVLYCQLPKEEARILKILFDPLKNNVWGISGELGLCGWLYKNWMLKYFHVACTFS